jgi:hypothetical protein
LTKVRHCLRHGLSGAVLFAAAPVLFAGTLPSPASAQAMANAAAPSVKPVYRMGRPAYDAPGFEWGSFLLHPSVWEDVAYDDNIFASDLRQASDTISTTSEFLAAASNWSRHSLSGQVYSFQQLYRDHDFENANTYGGETSGRLDISDSAFLRLDGGFVEQPQLRDSAEADITATKRPIYNTLSGTIGYSQYIDRFQNLAEIAAVKTAYTGQTEASRSSTDLRYHDRLSLQATGSASLFLDGAYATQDYLLRGDARDFSTWTGKAGVSIGIADLVQGEISAGVLEQQYRNTAFRTLVTPTVSGDLTWNFLPLTSLSLAVARTVTGTESFCDPSQAVFCERLLGLPPGSISASQRSSLESTVAQAGLQHEFWHDLLGEARFRFAHEKYELADLIDNDYQLNVNGRWLINQHLELDLEYAHNVRQANKPITFYNSGPYSENTVSLTLKGGI